MSASGGEGATGRHRYIVAYLAIVAAASEQEATRIARQSVASGLTDPAFVERIDPDDD